MYRRAASIDGSAVHVKHAKKNDLKHAKKNDIIKAGVSLSDDNGEILSLHVHRRQHMLPT